MPELTKILWIRIRKLQKIHFNLKIISIKFLCYSFLQALRNTKNQFVTVPFGSQTKTYDCLCMTAIPDYQSFALIGGCQFDYSGSVIMKASWKILKLYILFSQHLFFKNIESFNLISFRNPRVYFDNAVIFHVDTL